MLKMVILNDSMSKMSVPTETQHIGLVVPYDDLSVSAIVGLA